MSENPIISVVIPLYNKRASIGRTLESVRLQTIEDIEILVVDDGSTDGSGEIVEAFPDPRIRYLQQPNTGPNQARNNAVKVARSDLFAFIDADDEWKPTHLENILEAEKRFPSFGLYATNFYWVMPDGTIKHPVFPGLVEDHGFCQVNNYFAVSKKNQILTCSSVALNRQVLEQAGGFPASEFVKQAQPLWVKLVLNHPIGFCLEPTLIYRLDAENRWDAHIRKIRSRLTDCDTVLLKNLDEALSKRHFRNTAVPIEDIRAYRRQVLFWRASDLIRIGQLRKGRIAALKMFIFPEYYIRSIKLIIKSFIYR
ncbi:MAG: glycosyltransferase family 2 protein [Acidobacteria bacterium]|nr:glycosyltransferase family 2 protein [Acidobacteriota bacterium]